MAQTVKIQTHKMHTNIHMVKRSLEVSSRYQIKFYLRKKADSPGIPTIQQPFGKPT